MDALEVDKIAKVVKDVFAKISAIVIKDIDASTLTEKQKFTAHVFCAARLLVLAIGGLKSNVSSRSALKKAISLEIDKIVDKILKDKKH